MGIITDTLAGVITVLDSEWDCRKGNVVPTTDTVKLKDGAVEINACYLYADMADSSGAAQSLDREVTAKIIRAYLNAATRILKHYGGEIRSFDGDRVMAIYIGPQKETSAIRAALALNWAVVKVIKPQLAKE